jgi:hypothetical protein
LLALADTTAQVFHGFVSPRRIAVFFDPRRCLLADSLCVAVLLQAFIMDVSTADGTLIISAEEKETGDRWRGQVSAPRRAIDACLLSTMARR